MANKERTKSVVEMVELLLNAEDGANYATVCLLSDIAISLSAIADSLEKKDKDGESE